MIDLLSMFEKLRPYTCTIVDFKNKTTFASVPFYDFPVGSCRFSYSKLRDAYHCIYKKDTPKEYKKNAKQGVVLCVHKI